MMRTHKLRGDPQILVMLQDTHAVLGKLKQEGEDTAECRKWLEQAEEMFNRRIPLCYSAYDRIWQMLHKIRHVICRIGSTSDLLSIVVDIRGSLFYVPKEKQKRYEGELDNIEESLRLHLPKHEVDKPAHVLPMQEIRFDMELLSRITADARDALWRKANLLRTRLVITAVILGILLASSLWLVPEFLNITDVTRTFVLAIIAFGAIGGLVSALSTMEPLEAPSYTYYIRRTLLFLKPLIGAAGGLIIYLIQVSGVITIVTAFSNPRATYLVLAIAAGFTERLFVSKIEQVADLSKKKEKQKDTGE
jgi:hypothetical protein